MHAVIVILVCLLLIHATNPTTKSCTNRKEEHGKGEGKRRIQVEREADLRRSVLNRLECVKDEVVVRPRNVTNPCRVWDVGKAAHQLAFWRKLDHLVSFTVGDKDVVVIGKNAVRRLELPRFVPFASPRCWTPLPLAALLGRSHDEIAVAVSSHRVPLAPTQRDRKVNGTQGDGIRVWSRSIYETTSDTKSDTDSLPSWYVTSVHANAGLCGVPHGHCLLGVCE